MSVYKLVVKNPHKESVFYTVTDSLDEMIRTAEKQEYDTMNLYSIETGCEPELIYTISREG